MTSFAKAYITDRLHDSFYNLDYNSSSCLPPCIMIKSTIKSLKHFRLSEQESWLYFRYEKTFRQSTIKTAYGFDDLIIEMGSSLGLWLGLSAVGLFDVVVCFIKMLSMRVKQLSSRKVIFVKVKSVNSHIPVTNDV